MFIPRIYIAGLVATVGLASGCGGGQPVAGDAAPSVERGQTIYAQCRACHSLSEGAPHMIGPNLYGIFDRKAGLAPGFAYSDVLANADVIWTAETMDRWLAQPSEFLPGNRMIFVGVNNAVDRASLIVFLQQATGAQ